MLNLEGITKVFGRGTVNEKVALDNISLIVHEGDFITIIGHNIAVLLEFLCRRSCTYGYNNGTN